MKYAIILLVVAIAVGAFAAPGEAPKEKRGLALGYHGSLLSQSYVQPAVVSSSSYISHPSLISHGPVLAHAPLVAHGPYISHAPLALHY